MNLKEKLSKIQNELKAPKNQYNSFGKYSYRNCEDILEAAKPICAKYGTVLKIYDEINFIGERYYVKAIAKIMDVESDEEETVSAYAREEETKKGMDGSQVTGAASSYARKYALNGLFNIDDTKDADTDEHAKVTRKEDKKVTVETKTVEKPITEEQVKSIHILLTKIEKAPNKLFTNFENKDVKENYYKIYKINSSKELTETKAKDMIEKLKVKANSIKE